MTEKGGKNIGQKGGKNTGQKGGKNIGQKGGNNNGKKHLLLFFSKFISSQRDRY